MNESRTIGDLIETQDVFGQVEAIDLRTTRLRDVTGTVWHFPNGEIRRVGSEHLPVIEQQLVQAIKSAQVAGRAGEATSSSPSP